MDVRWHPGGFAYESATLFGLELDRQVAVEAYDRLVMSTRRAYEQINLQGDRAVCLAYWDDLTADWLSSLGQDPNLGAALSVFARERMYGSDSTCFVLYPETRTALEQLQADGHRMVVLSNWDYSLDRTLQALGIDEFFEQTFASLEHGVEKPETELFRIVESALGVSADEFIHFGDNPLDDLEGARRAGWHGVLVDRSIERSERPRIPSLESVNEALAWIG